ncbi:MAG: hypothetical protein ACFFB5_05930 [Promethearchaeota archaeon]
MSNKQFKDAITFSQPLMKEITDNDSIKLFKDKNLSSVIEFLRTHKGPMTVTELENAFKNTGKKKSDKTIYRYLKTLEEANLVIQAGKRVFKTDKKKLKTQTLYMRTAKIFFPIMDLEEKEELSEEEQQQEEKMIEAIGISIGKYMNVKLISTDCLKEFLKKFYREGASLPRTIIQNASDEITDLLTDLDWKFIESAVKTINFLVILSDKTNWQIELANCFHD